MSVAVGVVMARFLYGITPTDPLTYLGVFTLLAAASLVACYLPAAAPRASIRWSRCAANNNSSNRRLPADLKVRTTTTDYRLLTTD